MDGTDNVIDETVAAFMRFAQPLNETTIEYAEILCAKVLRFHQVCNEYVVNGNFMEGLQAFRRKSMRWF